MNHEIDFYPDDIYIRECSSQSSVASLFSKTEAELCIECRWTPSCPPVWGKRPLQTGCLSEALTSSALVALTGFGRLFISPFSQNHHRDWFEGDWSLAVWSIQPTVVKTDTKGIWRLCVCVCYVTCPQKWHQMAEVNYVCFSKHRCHLYIHACSSSGQLVTSPALFPTPS